MSVKAQLRGADKLIAKLRHLQKQSTAAKVLRRAVNVGTTPILQSVRGHVHSDEGDLKRAMTKKVSGKGLSMNGIVGADAGYVGQEGHKLTGDAKAAVAPGDDVKRPAKYDHLVEFGHLSPDGKAIPPHPFIRPGWDDSIAEAQEEYQAALAEGIEKEASKG